jgi:hypothetical protein
MNTTLDEFESKGGTETFVGVLTDGLGIDETYIEIKEVREGSVIVDYNLQTDGNQKFSLDELKKKQNDAINGNLLDFGFPILDFSAGGESLISQPAVAEESEAIPVEETLVSEVVWYENVFY